MKVPIRGLLATILAGGGLFWVWWSFSHHLAGSKSPRPSHIAPSATVTSVLGNVAFDTTPTALTVKDDIERTVNRAREQLGIFTQSESEQIPRIDDLLAVFGQSFEDTIAPDFDARCEMMRQRGDSWEKDRRQGERDRWMTQNELTRNARYALNDLEIRMLFKKGKRIASTPEEEGFATLVSHPAAGRMPIPEDAEKGHLDVVEIRLPMEKTQVEAAGRSGKRPVLIGYQYAWNTKRKEWTPWAICIYSDPNDIHYAIYF